MADLRSLEGQLLAAVPDGLLLIGLDGLIHYANQQLADLVLHRIDDFVGLPAAALADNQRQEHFARHLERMRAGHPGGHNTDAQLIRSDGTSLSVLVSWAPVHDAEGVVVGYLHRINEYTERRRLIDELEEREQQLDEAQRIAHVGSWTWDVATDRVWWSEELHRMYGFAKSDHTFEWFLEHLHEDDRERVATTIADAMVGGDGFAWEGRALTATGSRCWIRGLGVIERDAAGEVTRIQGTAQDITDLNDVAQHADQAARRLRLLQELADASNRSSSVADVLVRAAHVIHAHSAWRPICAWIRTAPGAELTSLVLPEADGSLPPPHLAGAERAWETKKVDTIVLADRPGHSLVSLPVLAGGSVALVTQMLADVTVWDAETTALVAQIADQLGRVAERERAAEELAEARDAALAASRHKTDFLATMSHEIRTPMNGVIGLTDLLLATDLDDRQRRLAEGLRGAGLTLLSLIDDVLDLSKIESGKLALESTIFDVREVLDKTAIVIAGPAQEKRLELVIACEPAVPTKLVGAPVRLGQVLTNLASNAVKFTDTGEVVIDISLAAEPTVNAPDAAPGAAHEAPTGVLLRGEVRDTGVGVGNAGDLFEAFTQADRSTTRRHGGTGLGLAICRQLVQSMGGEIGVDPAPGGGSIFWFTARVGVAPGTTPDVSPRTQLPPRRILLVDDNASAARHIVRLLAGWGLTADIVDNPVSALPLLLEAVDASRPYDQALLDLDMPGLDGLRLAAQIRSHEQLAELDLVLLAGDLTVQTDEVLRVGFRTWVAKPIQSRALLAALRPNHPGSPRRPTTLEPRTPTRSLGLSVLLVEDNTVNQLVAQGLLEAQGCVATTVANGEEAVAALQPGHPFDLVLMDCRMPRLDGYDATRAVRAAETGRRVPIIAMTASALPGERQRCLEAGMDDFLTKPVDSAQLAQALVRWSDVAAAAGRSRREAGRQSGRGSGRGAEPQPAPDAGPSGAPQVLNAERTEMLAELVKDGVNFFERTRRSFLSRIDETIAALQIAIADGDFSEAGAIAHQLVGSSANVGLERLAAAAAEVEAITAAADSSSLAAGTSPTAGLAAAVGALEEQARVGVEALVAVG